MLEGPGESALVLDPDGIVLAIGLNCARRLNRQPDDLIGASIWECFPPDSHQRRMRVLKQVATTGKGMRVEDRSGSRIYDVVIHPIRDAGDRLGAVAVVAREVTHIKRAVDDLRESEARYRSLFDNNHAVMLLIDPITGEICDANPAACRFYGYSRAELVTMKITEINQLTPAEVHREMEAARRQERGHFLFRHRLADGDIRDVEVYSGPIEVEGRKLLYSIIHDITARRIAQEKLRTAHEHLQAEQQALADKNTALKEVLERVGQEKEEIAERFQANVNRIIMPLIERLSTRVSNPDRVYIDLMRESLQDIASPFMRKLGQRTAVLTPRELEVANLIRTGKSSKEIANVLSVAPGTVIQQRKSIRRKLRISGRKVNLRSHLQTL